MIHLKERFHNAYEEDVSLVNEFNILNKNPNEFKFTSVVLADKIFKTTLEDIDNANEWYENIWQDITDDIDILSAASLSFTELFMNAYEHGNLDIDAQSKNILINNDTYFKTLLKKEKTTSKKIRVKMYKLEHDSVIYILTLIIDEGKGFNTKILNEMFKHLNAFHGRGVFISRKNSLGVYYNSKGNSVLFLNKISKS